MKKYIIGAGGHATVICDIAKKQQINLDGVFIDNGAKNLTDLPFIDIIENITNYNGDEFIFAFGNINARKKIEQDLTLKGTKWYTLIDNTAIIGSNVEIGEGTVIMPGAIINSGVKIGNHVIINSGSVIEHGTVIGDHTHISPGSVVCGNCHIGNETWIGAGSIIINEINIGNNTIIGAGSVVVKDIESNIKAFGNPARIQKEKQKIKK